MTGLFNKTKKEETTKAKSSVKKEKKVVEKVEKAEVANVEVKKAPKDIHSNAFRVLVRPVISEKASIAESLNVYTFKVSREATKDAVKHAIKQTYGIVPEKVRIINVEGKATRTRFGGSRRSDWKKALVTLPKGQSIRIHEGV